MTTDRYEWTEKQLELLYKADNIVIWYHPGLRIIHADWIGYQKEAALKDAAEMLLEIFQDKKCTKVLNDNTRVIGHWYHSVDWANENWFPRIIASGLKHFAWICSEDVFTQLSGKRAIPEGNEVVQAFTTFDDALAWLIKC